MKLNLKLLIRNILVLISMLMLTACLSPAKNEPPTKFILNKVPTYVATKKPRSIVLLVTAPETRPIYNTTQMAYTIRPYQIAYFSKNQWAETPADMLQPLLIQTLQKTRYFKAVVTPPYIGKYDYTLNTQVLELLQDYKHRTPLLLLSVRAQIIKTSTNRLVASKQFSIVYPIPQVSPYGGVFAANCATAILLEQISRFCLDHMR